MTKKPYTAGPANDANMFCGSQIDSASMDEKRKDQTKRKLLKDLIAIQGQDEEGLYEVLEGFMGNVAARMVPNILEIVRKTTPAAPALNEEQINTQRWQHLRKELQSMKSCDKKGHAALVADQIEDHRIAEMILPKVLDKVRSTTPGKIKVAEAFVQGGARLNLGGRGVSRSSFNKKKVAVAKVRQAVKRSVGTPIFRAMLDATTPTIPKGKPPRRENTISAPNFDAAANAPRIVRTPLETITNIPIPGTLHPNTPVPETPVAQQDFTPSDSPSSRQELDDAYFEAQLYSPTSPEARTPSCMESCCSPDDRRNTTTKRRRVSFGRVAYCSPVAEEASADSMMLDEPPLASRIPERSPEPSESSEFNLDPIVDDIVDDNSPASASNDADPIVVETVLEEEDEESEAASSDPMMLDDTPHAPPITARSPEPSESSEFNSDPIVDFNSDPIADANSPASASNHTDPIVVETVLEEQDEEYEAASSDSMMLDETPQASLVTARSLESSESNSDPMTNGMSPASSDPTPVATSLPRSPPKDGRQPNRSAHLPVVQSPPRRTKKRKATLTFEKKQELCKEELGEQIISHLAKNKGTWKARDRRPFLAAVAHHEKKVIEKVVGVKINAGEYKNIRIHAKYPGSFVDARKPRVFRNKIKKELLLKLLHHLDDPGNLQRLAVGRQMVEIMGGQQCVELDNVTRNKTCAILAAEFIVKLGEELDEMVVAEDGTFQPLPESAERCQCLETGTGRRCMKMCGHDKRPENGSGEEDETDPKHYRHKYTPPGSISFTTAMELVDTLTGEDLKALSGLDDIKVAKGMENFKRQREIADLYFSGAGKDQMKQRIDDHELFCQTDFVPHLQEVSENKCNCLTCGFCNEGKSCENCDKSQQLKPLIPTAVRVVILQIIRYLCPEKPNLFLLALLYCLIFYLDDPEDVVCPDADKHKPSCTKCAEGFAITHDIKACITDTIAVFKTRNKVGPTSSSSPSSDDSSSGANYADDCGETSAESSSSDGTPQHDGDGVATWEKKSSAILKTELRRRGEKVSGKVGELRERLVASDKARAARERRDAETSHLSPAALAELEQHEEYLHAIDECTTNLREYRSHLSRHVSEEKYATEKLENLADDEAVITCDYKMKILSCFFREAQSKWFGKRGVSCLGFMIATNAEDEADRAKGVKDVKFVMMFTDDGLQDDWQIACAKHTIYNDHLPSQIKKVLFTSDGAGCFKSKLHRAIQPFWKHWTGVDEIELRITPAGDGKSCLDGMFGRLTYVLHGSVDQGNSYFDAESILKAIQDSNGLSATTFLGFHAVRANQLKADLELDGRLESVLLSVLDPNRDATDHSIQLFKHSGYGKGVKVDLATQSSFSRYEVNKNNEGETTDDDWISKAYNQDVSNG